MPALAASEPAGNSGGFPKLGLRFAIGYVVIAGVLFSIYGFPFELFGARSDWLSGYLQMYARLAGTALRLFESGVVVTGDRIDGRFSLQIVRNCDAIEVNILFASAILAFPAPWRRWLAKSMSGCWPALMCRVVHRQRCWKQLSVKDNWVGRSSASRHRVRPGRMPPSWPGKMIESWSLDRSTR